MAKSSHVIAPSKGLMASLMTEIEAKSSPKVGSLVEGKVVYVGKNEVYIDIDGLTTGLIRGRELNDESGDYSNLKIGDVVSATIVEIENEVGLMELSFRHAGHQKAWSNLIDLMKAQENISVSALEANKGGLMVKVGGVIGFLPVSQLTSEHYPRVEGGDKSKIFEMLKDLIGKDFEVKVIDVDETLDKLIVSEKAAWEEKQQAHISEFKVGDIITGKISGIVEFGVFIEFGGGLEGLVHISEMAWQRVDKPGDLFKVGDPLSARIIDIQGSKISLSIKRTIEDPWRVVAERYKVNEKVKGKVLKVNNFGLFVELDGDIHGLAHISELSNKKIKDINEIARPGDILEFTVISMDPENHRLGLSLKGRKSKSDKEDGSEETSEEEAEGKEKKVKTKEKKEKVEVEKTKTEKE